MVWDGMPCAKGLVVRWYGTECPVRRDLRPDGMGRNARMKGFGSIFFVFELRQFNSSKVMSQKKRAVAM